MSMDEFQEQYGYSKKEWEACLKVLNILKTQPTQNPDNRRFAGLIKKIAKMQRSIFQVKNRISKSPKK